MKIIYFRPYFNSKYISGEKIVNSIKSLKYHNGKLIGPLSGVGIPRRFCDVKFKGSISQNKCPYSVEFKYNITLSHVPFNNAPIIRLKRISRNGIKFHNIYGTNNV